jgi:site-specific recombinase XerD
MRVQKGLSEVTIQARRFYTEDFLRWFFREHNSLHQLKIADVDEAIARKGRDDGYARLSVQVYASGIRNFLRYAESRCWCSRTYRLVRRNLRYTFQEMHAEARRLSGES